MRSGPAVAPLDALLAWYATLDRERLSRIGEFYARRAWFKDPFNEVQGVDAIRGVFEHMFESTRAPRFEIGAAFASGSEGFAAWTFRCGLGRREIAIRGATHLRFDAAGRVIQHRDYWDAAEELYEQLPLIGALMRLLRRRLAAPRRQGPVPAVQAGARSVDG